VPMAHCRSSAILERMKRPSDAIGRKPVSCIIFWYSRSQKVVTLDFRGHILCEYVSRERLSQMKNKSNNKTQLDFDSSCLAACR
jgi:hypothetical protein